MNNETGELYKEGETMRLPKLSATLRKISEGGEAAFYGGNLMDDILLDLQDIGESVRQYNTIQYNFIVSVLRNLLSGSSFT